jgi:5-methylcytosine-specific restriction endonuclease McrA
LRSDPGYLREQVFLRDRGVCALCGSDTAKAFLELRRARGNNRRTLLSQWGLKGLSRRTLWDADHILPVAEGGGECDLENVRTLCLRCHRKATQELRARLNARKPIAPENAAKCMRPLDELNRSGPAFQD